MTRLASLRFRSYDLGLRQEWVTSRHAATRRRGWVVVAVTTDGVQGFGDCPLDVPGHDGLGGTEAELAAIGEGLIGAAIEEVALSGPGAAGAAIECALLDALARTQGVSLRHLLDPAAADSVAVNAVATLAGLGEASRSGFRIVKLKVGARPLQDDIAALLAASIPDGVTLRLDANRAWTWEEAALFVDAVAALPIEQIEEPLAVPSLPDLTRLQQRTAFALALDESLPGLGPAFVLEQRPVRRLVLKLGAIGGLRQTLAWAQKARAAGMGVVVTSRAESAVGVAAAAHLAAAVEGGRKEGLALAHGLATSEWLKDDLGIPLAVSAGRLTFDGRPGLGVDIL